MLYYLSLKQLKEYDANVCQMESFMVKYFNQAMDAIIGEDKAYNSINVLSLVRFGIQSINSIQVGRSELKLCILVDI